MTDDRAVQAAAEALGNADGPAFIGRANRRIVAEVAVAAARPIIEAEVIARLAARWQSLADHDPLCGMGTEAQHLHGCGTPVCVCLPVAEVRERIAADIEAQRSPEPFIPGTDHTWQSGRNAVLDLAARIARGVRHDPSATTDPQSASVSPEEALTVRCGTCDADPGEACVTVGPWPGRVQRYPHESRYGKAREARPSATTDGGAP